MNDPISFAMPSSCGQGIQAKMFMEKLIDINNNFIEKCWAIIGQQPKYVTND